MRIYRDLTEDEIEKFKPLLDKSVEDVKAELQTLAKNYYESIIVNDTKLFQSTVAELGKYLEYNIRDIDEYVNYCLVVASNMIIKKICDVDSIYVPDNVDLKFRSSYTRRNEDYIKREGLDDNQVELLTQYIKEKHDISCLNSAINEDLVNKLKPKTIIPLELKSSILVSTNYIRNGEIKKSGELFFALDKMVANYNE